MRDSLQCFAVPKLFQKSNFNVQNGFYFERKQIPRISVSLWKIWANIKPKKCGVLPSKQRVLVGLSVKLRKGLPDHVQLGLTVPLELQHRPDAAFP